VAELPLSPEAWIAARVTARWRGSRSVATTPLKGDASTRRFWRATIATAEPRVGGEAVPPSAIAVDLGPDDLPLYARRLSLVPVPPPEPPWLTLQRFLDEIGAAVPRLYAADLSARMLLVEDVGDLPLFDAAARGDAADLYRLAVDQLLFFHLVGSCRITRDCIAAQVAYDERLFRWELEQFIELGATAIAPGADSTAIALELDDLAARLGRLPRVFSHRDYHGHNLHIQFAEDGAPVLRVIDFQDALMAPAAQDLAVLLTTRDTARIISPRVEQRVLEYYHAAHLRNQTPTMPQNELFASYRLCVVQHALKVIGRFTHLERNGKRGYARYIPDAVAQARRMLAQSPEFPKLREAFRE
jgi:aminoglycoside/choline kinase family phosphotransferase